MLLSSWVEDPFWFLKNVTFKRTLMVALSDSCLDPVNNNGLGFCSDLSVVVCRSVCREIHDLTGVI